MNRGGFSWKRLLGVSAAKARLSRQTGIPLSKSGRQRKLGAAASCSTLGLTLLVVGLAASLLLIR